MLNKRLPERINYGDIATPTPEIITVKEPLFNQSERVNYGIPDTPTPPPSTELIIYATPQPERINYGETVATSDIKAQLQNRLLCLYSLSDLNKTKGVSSIGILTNRNEATVASGKLGNCYSFNMASKQQLYDPNNRIKLSEFESFTIGCWFYSTNNNTYGPPISFGRDALSAFEVHGNRSINTNTIIWYISTNGTNVFGVGWNGFIVNEWFLVLIEYKKSSGRFALYANNVLRQERFDLPTNQNIVENTETGLCFGSYARLAASGLQLHFSGLIDESFVMIWNTTQDERDWLWNNGNGNSLV